MPPIDDIDRSVRKDLSFDSMVTAGGDDRGADGLYQKSDGLRGVESTCVGSPQKKNQDWILEGIVDRDTDHEHQLIAEACDLDVQPGIALSTVSSDSSLFDFESYSTPQSQPIGDVASVSSTVAIKTEPRIIDSQHNSPNPQFTTEKTSQPGSEKKAAHESYIAEKLQEELLERQLHEQLTSTPSVYECDTEMKDLSTPRHASPNHSSTRRRRNGSTLTPIPSTISKTSPGSNSSTPQRATSGTSRIAPKGTSIPNEVPDVTPKSRASFRPKSSIPQALSWKEYGLECVQAAESSRLSPYALHPNEYELLRDHISFVQNNPVVSITLEEALGCAKEARLFDMAEVAFEWLIRNGYINFGCIEVPRTITTTRPVKRKRNIVVIGAGVSGLGCARQLESLLSQFVDRFDNPELIPNVTIFEGRKRLGGRVYSHPLKDQTSNLPDGKMSRIDLGGQIITGFQGNPIATIFQDQLKIPWHQLFDKMNLYDINGQTVDPKKDSRVQNLYNDVLDRVAVFKHKYALPRTVEGDRMLIDISKDPSSDGGHAIARVEENEAELPPMPPSPPSSGYQSPFSASVDKLTGKPSTATGSSATIPAAEQMEKLGWTLKRGVNKDETVPLGRQSNGNGHNVLGKTMDAVVQHYRELIDIAPLDLRLYNWHHANLEYANAARTDNLSLEHWDQDDGNEFGGAHAMIVGGYSQIPRGIFMMPTPLNVKVNKAVKKITYSTNPEDKGVRIECEDGTSMQADQVVITLPLGVLKSNNVKFDPPLPSWKNDAIKRLGFGLLNKVVLVYDRPFWDIDNDMIGALREPHGDDMLQSSYEMNRGRFYMFWNCMKVTGRPVLVALMAGEAAEQTEKESDHNLIQEATDLLRRIFPNEIVPLPSESIVTRWRSDPFSQGTYSYVAPGATGYDYDLLAKPIGEVLFFAGEASCRTHPATVHGAYISGLRAASEVVEAIIGPVKIKKPLVVPKIRQEKSYESIASMKKRKAELLAAEQARHSKAQRVETNEERLKQALADKLGPRPLRPEKVDSNPFLLYQIDFWRVCKAVCNEALRKSSGKPDAVAGRNEVRAALGQKWTNASAEEKKPYLDRSAINKAKNDAAQGDFQKALSEWDVAAEKFRQEWRSRGSGETNGDEINENGVNTDGVIIPRAIKSVTTKETNSIDPPHECDEESDDEEDFMDVDDEKDVDWS